MGGLEQAKRPVTVLAGRYGHPLHPALVAVPIGAWIASFVFDIASHLVSDPEPLAQASRWLIALGVLGALTFSGYLGGELAYRYGVRVADEATQQHGYQRSEMEETI